MGLISDLRKAQLRLIDTPHKRPIKFWDERQDTSLSVKEQNLLQLHLADLRYDFCRSMASHLRCGLFIQMYEDHTEYYLDYSVPKGKIVEHQLHG